MNVKSDVSKFFRRLSEVIVSTRRCHALLPVESAASAVSHWVWTVFMSHSDSLSRSTTVTSCLLVMSSLKLFFSCMALLYDLPHSLK